MEDLAEDEEAAIGGGGAFPSSAPSRAPPPAITISTSLTLPPGEDLAPSPTSTQFSPVSATLDLPKVKDIDPESEKIDQLAPLPPFGLASPPLGTPLTSPPRPSRRRPLTPRNDHEMNAFLVPISLLPPSDPITNPASLSPSRSSRSLTKSISRLSLGLGGGPLKITHSLTTRNEAALFSWGEPDEQFNEKKIKIFGPEVVIEDPRVIALHKRVVSQILLVGAGWTLVWVGVCLGVPGPK